MLNLLQKGQKILLVEPPFYRFFDYERWHYPITLDLIATYLDEMGFNVMVYDADKPSPNCSSLNRTQVREKYPLYKEALNNENHPIWAEVQNTIEKYAPDVVGLTSITAKIDATDKIAKMVKQLYGNKVTTILGGSHVQGMLASYPGYRFISQYDHLVIQIPNLVDRTPNKNLIMNVNEYSAKNLSTIMTSSGCPNSCTFCCHSYDKKIIYRNIDSIREELTQIRESYGASWEVYVVDDCLLSNNKHFRSVCSIMSDLDLKFSAGSRIMALSPDKITEFINSGGVRLLVGVESGSQQILDKVKKKLKIEEIKRRTKWLNDAGIPWSAFFVVGFPFETLDDLKITRDLIDEIQPSFVSLNRFTPYPGTEIFNEYYADKGLKFKDLFQLNPLSGGERSSEIEEYINQLFKFVDEYNLRKQ